MKPLFASLVCLVFTISQSFAIGGGPNYGAGGVTTTGIYAGVMLPSSSFNPGQNSLGLFSITFPKTGLGTGTVVIFGAGLTYAGTFQGVADPDSGKIVGEIDTTSTVTIGSESNVETAVGGLQGTITGNSNSFSTATARITGSADVQFSVFANSPFLEIIYDVIGFKQAEATA